MEITREPTEQEKADFTDISSKEDNALSKFYAELTSNEQKVIKKGLPFATKAATDDFKDYYEDEVKKNMRKNGYLKPEEIKPFKINWAKYSDLVNFELLEEGEVSDSNLSKKNPGLDVAIAFKKYKYKGYRDTYTIMEEPAKAILRAKKKSKEIGE